MVRTVVVVGLVSFAVACDASKPGQADPSPAAATPAPIVEEKEEPSPKQEEPPTQEPRTEEAAAEDDGSPKAVEPPPAEASPPAPPSEPLPALPFGEWTPSSDDTLLSEKMQRRLRSALRKQHGAPTQLAKTILMPRPDGGLSVVGLYEYSAFQACVTHKGGGDEARSACVDEAVNSDDTPMAALRKCTGQGIVRARFGAPPAKNPAYGGALRIEADRSITAGCTIHEIRTFALRDIDGDQRVELELDIIGNTPDMTFRDPTRFDVKSRMVAYYHDDLEPQFGQVLAEWGFDETEARERESSRIVLRDTNGDGRQDIVRETVFEEDPMCELDEVGWPKLEECKVEWDGEEETLPIEETVFVYDAERDVWEGPDPEE